MSGRFVRSSKYRHVFGRSTRKEQCYDNLRVSKNAWDTNLVKVNPRYLSVNWETGGGGAFAVIPLEETGKVPERFPLFRGHTAVVLDTDWNPFNDSLIASGADDGKVLLWRVPEGFSVRTDTDPDDVSDVAPVGKLPGHPKKVGQVLFNPVAENVLASASGDFSIKIWDIEAGTSKLSLKLGDVIQSLSWSANGSMLSTTSRDKKLRFWDVRQQRPVQEVAGHSGAKNSRSVWMGDLDRVATTGFSKMSDRQLALWDIRAPREPINGFKVLDSQSGVCVPFWDDGTKCIYLAGKGDGNIRYFEYENDKFEYLSEYKSADPQRGIGFMPKRGVNMHDNEVVRIYKTVNDTYIEPVSFIVPRRTEVFQEDIYPPTAGLRPAMSSGEWFEGKEAVVPKVDMVSLYEGEGLKELPADAEPAAKSAPPPKAEEPKKKEEPEPKPAATSTPGPVAAGFGNAPRDSIKEQSASMAAMANKYADSDEKDEEEDETSSFEEISKPSQPPPPTISLSTAEEVEKDVGKSREKEAEKPASSPPGLWKAKEEPAPKPAASNKTAQQASEPLSSSTPGPSTPTQDEIPSVILREIEHIKELVAEQTRTIARQSQEISVLNIEIDDLKSRIK